jgi:2-oxoglutarate ferredoxin oxidoreductase subunit beta
MNQFNGYTPTWCPGCGDFGIYTALKRALGSLYADPSEMTVVFGIGCAGNMNDFLNAYALHALHGRAIPNAIGIKIANHDRPVFVIAGDGDTYGEGGNHFMHACRGNHDITCIIHDNGVYGLTTGQCAPTANKGYKGKSTPQGIIETPINPLTLALSQGATFVAQGFAGNLNHLQEMITLGAKHKGFSLVNILQPCVTFNKLNTYSYYRDKTYLLDQTYDKTNFDQALVTASEPTAIERFPLGVIYESSRPTYTESLPQLVDGPLLYKKRFTDYESIVKEYV